MITFYNDGFLEATLYPSGWVFVRWVQNQHGRLQKTLIRNLCKLERIILELHRPGWCTRSESTHKDFHKLLTKFGAMPREIDEEGFQVFIKPLRKEGDLHVWDRR